MLTSWAGNFYQDRDFLSCVSAMLIVTELLSVAYSTANVCLLRYNYLERNPHTFSLVMYEWHKNKSANHPNTITMVSIIIWSCISVWSAPFPLYPLLFNLTLCHLSLSLSHCLNSCQCHFCANAACALLLQLHSHKSDHWQPLLHILVELGISPFYPTPMSTVLAFALALHFILFPYPLSLEDYVYCLRLSFFIIYALLYFLIVSLV